MRFGQFLATVGEAERIKREIADLPFVSWQEVLAAKPNCISNQDYTGARFEGEIKSIQQKDDQIIILCKWANVLQPVFDEDGDLDESQMEWQSWHILQTSFSSKNLPHKVSGESKFIIQSWLDARHFTTNVLTKVKKFESL